MILVRVSASFELSEVNCTFIIILNNNMKNKKLKKKKEKKNFKGKNYET